MKLTLNESTFIDRFKTIRPNDFSDQALVELFAHLEQMEEDTGEEMEFDPVSICCDFGEIPLREAFERFEIEEEDEDERLDMLQLQDGVIAMLGDTVLVDENA